jgi:hypothetical protein
LHDSHAFLTAPNSEEAEIVDPGTHDGNVVWLLQNFHWPVEMRREHQRTARPKRIKYPGKWPVHLDVRIEIDDILVAALLQQVAKRERLDRRVEFHDVVAEGEAGEAWDVELFSFHHCPSRVIQPRQCDDTVG